jgi:glycosyltransferase involved in cell wall biosynthesis
MKVSIITVVLNCVDYIDSCIDSVIAQDYQNLEYIIIDGGSADGTMEVIKKYQDKINYVISEVDNGMYDALNRGISVASGELIGILNADDQLAESNVISAIVNCFKENECDAVYGNLNYVKRNNADQIVRRWKSEPFKSTKFKYGWAPAHPTLYIKRELYLSLGMYAQTFGSCSDYELILRIFYKNRATAVFLNKLIVIMRTGGMSNGSLKKIIHSLTNDYKALVQLEIAHPLLVLFLKKVRKLNQFF